MATHNSPKGRPVEVVSGDAAAITARGQQIVNLGSAMADAANLLDRLANSGTDMEGQAVEKLREASREVNTELGSAADLYVEVGPFIRGHGESLSDVQSRMNSSVPEAESAWLTYQQRLADFDDAESAPVVYPSGTEPSDDGSERDAAEDRHREGVDDAREARDAAYQLWVSAGNAFDSDYDAWEDAFDTAVSGVRTSNDDGIRDDFWDNLDGFVEFALSVLAIAGMVLAVLALVVGGPIVALLALAVGVLALIGTAYQYGRGDAELWEVGLAVLGVLPFGAFGEFASGGFGAGMRTWAGLGSGGLSWGDDVARWSVVAGQRPSQWISAMRTLGPEAGFVTNSFDDIVHALVSGQDPAMWEVIGDLGTAGQQLAYATGAVGTFGNNINTAVGGVQGVLDIVLNPAPLRWPTW